MAMSNLSIDGEFRYIIQWFNEWSELQRDDFVPVLVEYLLRETPGEVYMNGMVNSVSTVGINDKPMSLFQCRIKLFREWNKKWPSEFKHKLKEKIIEMDAKVGEKIINELKGDDTGPTAEENSVNNSSNGVAVEVTTATETVAMPEVNADAEVLSAAVALVDATEEAINLDNRLAAVLSNETPVDDDDNDDNNATNVANVPVEQNEPAEPVQMQDRQLQQPQEENATAVTVA